MKSCRRSAKAAWVRCIDNSSEPMKINVVLNWADEVKARVPAK
jgi:hypothetical protein